MAKNNPLKQRQLKNVLIFPKFQLKFLSYFMGLFLISTACMYSTTFLFFFSINQKAMKMGIPEGHVFYTFMEQQKDSLDLLFLALAFLNMILLIGVGFFISHRVAGPIIKLFGYLRRLPEQKDIENFRLRKNDFFHELGPLLDKVKEKVK